MARQRARSRRWRVRTFEAIAAGVLILLAAAVFFWPGREGLVFAQVVEHVAQTQSLTGKADGYPFYIKGKLERWEGNTPNGVGAWTRLMDRGTVEDFTIIPAQKAAYRGREVAKFHNIYQMIRSVSENHIESLGEKSFDGQKLMGYSGSMKEIGEDGAVSMVPVQIWVDPKTKLPARIDYLDTTTGKPVGGMTDLQFDQILDDKLFAMEAPAGYKVIDRRDQTVQNLQPPATTQQADSLALHPGIGIGNVNLGDPPAKLIALLGEPESQEGQGWNGKEPVFKYPSLGLRIYIGFDLKAQPDGNSKLGVKSIFADSTNVSWPSHDFLGATDKGIRIGMTRKQVEAAYGTPSWENTNNADYRKIGLAVFYRSDGIHVSGFLIVKPSDKAIFG